MTPHEARLLLRNPKVETAIGTLNNLGLHPDEIELLRLEAASMYRRAAEAIWNKGTK